MGLVKSLLYKISDKRLLKVFKGQSIFPYYHLVTDEQVAHISHLYRFKNRDQFERDLDILMSGYKAIEPLDLLNKSELTNTFVLTFDDGLKEIYTVIYPILKKRKLSAIFFLNPDFVDNKKGLYKHYISIILDHLAQVNYPSTYLDWISKLFGFTYNSIEDFKAKFIGIKFSEREKLSEIFSYLNFDIDNYLQSNTPYITMNQIQEMINDGFKFGGHTMSHPPLDQLSHDEKKSQIIESMDWVKNHFKIDYSFFAFPFSDRGISKELIDDLIDYDPNIRIFGNSGLKRDIDPRIIQRFSLENPKSQTEKQIVMENLYKYFNIVTGKYRIRRK